jgi:hypothetical protein
VKRRLLAHERGAGAAAVAVGSDRGLPFPTRPLGESPSSVD